MDVPRTPHGAQRGIRSPRPILPRGGFEDPLDARDETRSGEVGQEGLPGVRAHGLALRDGHLVEPANERRERNGVLWWAGGASAAPHDDLRRVAINRGDYRPTRRQVGDGLRGDGDGEERVAVQVEQERIGQRVDARHLGRWPSAEEPDVAEPLLLHQPLEVGSLDAVAHERDPHVG